MPVEVIEANVTAETRHRLILDLLSDMPFGTTLSIPSLIYNEGHRFARPDIPDHFTDLQATGEIVESDLKWLVEQGYVAKATEPTEDPFWGSANPDYRATRFAITDEGRQHRSRLSGVSDHPHGCCPMCGNPLTAEQTARITPSA